MRNEALPADRVLGVETGGCPHTAIRDDTSMNLAAIAELEKRHPDVQVILSSRAAATTFRRRFRRSWSTFIYVIDVAEGDKIPRKGGPGDPAQRFAADQQDRSGALRRRRSRRDGARCGAMRGSRPIVFTNLKTGDGLDGSSTGSGREMMFEDADQVPLTAGWSWSSPGAARRRRCRTPTQGRR